MQTGFMQQEGRMPSITDQLKMQIIKECCEDLTSPAEIAVRQNMNVAWVRKIIHDAGRKLPTGYRLTANNGLQLSSNGGEEDQKQPNGNRECLGQQDTLFNNLSTRIHFLEQQSLDAIASIRLDMKRIENTFTNGGEGGSNLSTQDNLKDEFGASNGEKNMDSSANSSSVVVRMTLLEQQVRVLQKVLAQNNGNVQNYKTEHSNEMLPFDEKSNNNNFGKGLELTTSIKSEITGQEQLKKFPEFCGELQPSLDPYRDNVNAYNNNHLQGNMEQHPGMQENMNNSGINTNIYGMFKSGIDRPQEMQQNELTNDIPQYPQFSQMPQTEMPPGSVLSKINSNLPDISKATENDNEGKNLQIANKVVRQFSCSNCDFKSYQKPDVEQHIKDVHDKENNMEETHQTNLTGMDQGLGLPGMSSEDELQCAKCEFRADSKIQILIHTHKNHQSSLLNTVPMDGFGPNGMKMNQKPFPELGNESMFAESQKKHIPNELTMDSMGANEKQDVQESRNEEMNRDANDAQTMNTMQFLSTPTHSKEGIEQQQQLDSRSMPSFDFSFEGQDNLGKDTNAENKTSSADLNFMPSIETGIPGFNSVKTTPLHQGISSAQNTPSHQLDYLGNIVTNNESTFSGAQQNPPFSQTSDQPENAGSTQTGSSQEYQLKPVGAANPNFLSQINLNGSGIQLPASSNEQQPPSMSSNPYQLLQQPQYSFSLANNTSSITTTNPTHLLGTQTTSTLEQPPTTKVQQIQLQTTQRPIMISYSSASTTGTLPSVTNTLNKDVLQQLQGQPVVRTIGDKQIILKRKFPDTNSNNAGAATNLPDISKLVQGAQIIQGPNGKKFIILQQKPNGAGGIRFVNPQQQAQQLGGGIRLPPQILQQRPRAPLIIQSGIPGLAQTLQNVPTMSTTNNLVIPTSGMQIQIPNIQSQNTQQQADVLANIMAGRMAQTKPNP